MNVGFLGAGKLGGIVSLAIESKGHKVLVHDPYLPLGPLSFPTAKVEKGAEGLIKDTKIRNVPLSELVVHSDIIFVAVQTPHAPEFEGITRLPDTRRDFDYSYLVKAIADLSAEMFMQNKGLMVVVVSTVLPGTMRREVVPILSPLATLIYNPSFIAMGTVIDDYLSPEFTLVGFDGDYPWKLHNFYKTIHNRPIKGMSIESAELTKVVYNTLITTKTVYANLVGELCHKIPGCNVDHVMGALFDATDRLISTKYLTAQVGDGGGCHPRDNIAMSWLAKEVGLSHNLFEDIMKSREQQAEWFADLIMDYDFLWGDLPVIILGKAFKPETNIVTGSFAILLANILKEREIQFKHVDPLIDQWNDPLDMIQSPPALYFIATKHHIFSRYIFPKGSIVLDPFRYIEKQDGVEVIPIGVG